MKNNKIGVLIATSMNRIESLFNVALDSVLNQTKQPDIVLVVDDNNDDSVSNIIRQKIHNLNNPIIRYMKNTRTKNMSGTGAWNTGIYYLSDCLGMDSFVAILDDDDSWDSCHIELILNEINDHKNAIAVFPFIKRSDCPEVLSFDKCNLQPTTFLKSNPGVQGSNMCFRIQNLIDINGFDENLASCTDRDLMFRFLNKFGCNDIVIVKKKTVNHFAGNNTVTSNFGKKRNGLNSFFTKHIGSFSLDVLEEALQRSEKLFCFPDSQSIRHMFYRSRTILITGVCGFIGSHLARKFLQLGNKVIGIDNLTTGTEKNIEDFANDVNFSFYKISINDEHGLRNIFNQHKINYVFHLAALPRIKYVADHPQRAEETNVQGTSLLAKIARQYSVDLFVFASSSSVYGQSKAEIMSEMDTCNPMSLYAEQKLTAEKLLIQDFKNGSQTDDNPTNLLILRFFNVYGFSRQKVNEYTTLISRWISQIMRSGEIVINGNGEQSRDFTYIDDVTSALVNCVDVYRQKSLYDIINIGTGKGTSVNSVADMFGELLHLNIKRYYNTDHYQEPSFTLANNKHAFDLLHWKPQINLEDGIKKTIDATIQNQIIAIGVAMHNNAKTIRRCISSILNQKMVKRQLIIVLANDNSIDNWQQELSDLLNDKRIVVLQLHNNNVSKTRNAINNYICDNYPEAILIGRLDADDEYSGDQELSKIEQKFDDGYPDVVLAGNYLRQNGVIIERKNLATKRMSNFNYVLERLKKMTQGIPEGELPSCNIFVKPNIMHPYPDIKSGEDHAFVVDYLANQDKYKICFAEDLLPVIYNLGGKATSTNKADTTYIECRNKLYYKTLELCKTKNAYNAH